MSNIFRRREIPQAVTDLDKIETVTVSFKLHGKVHLIKPLTSSQFFNMVNNFASIADLSKNSQSITGDDLVVMYFKLFNGVCPTLKMEDIEKCTQNQIAALMNLILGKIMGKDLSEQSIEKKK